MNSTMTLAEMANSTNYATMNYAQLTELDFAFNWAIGQIKTLIPIKRREEMEMVTKTYVTVMNGYCATKEEILDCILKEEDNLKNESVFNMDSKDVDDQDAAVVSQEEKMDNGGTLPALPEAPRPNKLESEVVSSQDDNTEKPQNNETVLPETEEQTIVEEAIKDAMARPVKEEMDIVPCAEPLTEHLLSLEKMSYICRSIVLACIAVALRIHRSEIFRVLFTPYDLLAVVGEDRAVAAHPRRQYAVEHVDAS